MIKQYDDLYMYAMWALWCTKCASPCMQVNTGVNKLSKNKYGMNKVNQNQVITDITQWQPYIIVTQNDTFSDPTLAVHSKRYRICNKCKIYPWHKNIQLNAI